MCFHPRIWDAIKSLSLQMGKSTDAVKGRSLLEQWKMRFHFSRTNYENESKPGQRRTKVLPAWAAASMISCVASNSTYKKWKTTYDRSQTHTYEGTNYKKDPYVL